MRYIYTMRYQSAIKKRNEILQYAAWVDMVNIVLSEISKRRKNAVYYHVYVESKKYAKIMSIMKQKNFLLLSSNIYRDSTGENENMHISHSSIHFKT